jgi:putative protein-disulfide isomerase
MLHALELPDSLTPAPAKPVLLDYYTDPLCCWSWAFEPHWQRLRAEFGHVFSWRYRQGGLLRDWETYRDDTGAVSSPAQLGQLWHEAKHLTGTDMYADLWLHDPPASSYPACLAVKCAERQGAHAGELYLQAVRQAVMLHGRNVAKPDVLVALAEELAAQVPGMFDAAIFRHDMATDAGAAAFREDLQQVRSHHISMFPTIKMQRGTEPGVLLMGYQPYEALLQALARQAPDLFSVASLVDGGAG